MRRLRIICFIIAGIITIALLASCAKDPIEVVGKFSAFPMIEMPNETVLAWPNPTTGVVSDVYSVSLNTGKETHLGKMLAGYRGVPIDNNSWVIQSHHSDCKPLICVCDLTTKSSRILVNQASLERISTPVSPDKKTLLVKKNGLRTVDIATGKETSLLNNVAVLNAEWSGNSVIACYQPQGRKPALVERISLPGKKHTLVASKEARLYYPEITKSPDLKYIAYERNGKIVCESIADSRKWVIVDLVSGVNSPWLRFSGDSERLAVSVYTDGNKNSELYVFNTKTKRLSRTTLGLSIMHMIMWDWLSDNRTIFITTFAKDLRSYELWKVHPPVGEPAEQLKH